MVIIPEYNDCHIYINEGAPTGRILSLGILSERIRAERILAERIRTERILVTKYPPTVSILSRTYPIVNVSSVLTYPHRTYPPTDRILSLNKSAVWCSTPLLYYNYYHSTKIHEDVLIHKYKNVPNAITY